VEELRRSERDRLEQLWDEIGSTRDLASFFDELETAAEVQLDVRCRRYILQAMAIYCRQVTRSPGPGDVSSAKRLVKLVRERLAHLQKLTGDYERQLSNLDDEESRCELLAQARRECWPVCREAYERYMELASWAEVPNDRISPGIASRVQQALALELPFQHPDISSDFASALHILDELLGDWGSATNSKQGQAWRSEALSRLILSVQEALNEAMDPAPGESASTRFKPFLNIVLESLPAEIKLRVGDEALPKRIARLKGSQDDTPKKAKQT
jgi:hypothetical protein